MHNRLVMVPSGFDQQELHFTVVVHANSPDTIQLPCMEASLGRLAIRFILLLFTLLWLLLVTSEIIRGFRTFDIYRIKISSLHFLTTQQSPPTHPPPPPTHTHTHYYNVFGVHAVSFKSC